MPTKQKVIPYVEDTRNILVVRLDAPVSDEVSTTLRYALERGIEAEFQLEDSELSSEALPDNDGRGRMLFTESAEGGAGVLRRLHAEPDALARVAQGCLGDHALQASTAPIWARPRVLGNAARRRATTACCPIRTKPITPRSTGM